MMNKKKLSSTFYWLAILTSFGNLAAIVILHWKFIVNGKGVGSFTTLWFAGYFIISIFVWLAARLIFANRKLDIAYWISIAVPIITLFTVPISFYIE